MEDDRNYYNLVPIKEEINDVSSFEKWAELNFGVNPYSMPPQSEPEVSTQQMITIQATSELFTIGIEEKKNAGTSVQLTVVIDLDSRLSVDDIVVSDLFVPTHLQQPAPNAKYSLWMKLTGETEDGIEIDLTMSRCDKCKYRMMYKNKDEANSSRFCDVMSSKLTTTRRRGGGVPYDALQIQFRCTPVKCHKLSSVVTLELFLMDAFGKIVSKPNQKAKMKFRTSEKRSKSERMDSVSQPVSDLQRNIEKQFSNIFKDEDLSDALVKKLTKLKKLVNLSLEKNVQYENMGNDNSGKYSSTDSDSDEAYTPKMRKSF